MWGCNTPLQWRHDGRDSVSNHHPHDCLRNRLFRRKSKKASKLHVTDICVGNSPHKWPVTRKMFPFDDVIMSWLLHFYAFIWSIGHHDKKERVLRKNKICMWQTSHISCQMHLFSILKYFVTHIFLHNDYIVGVPIKNAGSTPFSFQRYCQMCNGHYSKIVQRFFSKSLCASDLTMHGSMMFKPDHDMNQLILINYETTLASKTVIPNRTIAIHP